MYSVKSTKKAGTRLRPGKNSVQTLVRRGCTMPLLEADRELRHSKSLNVTWRHTHS